MSKNIKEIGKELLGRSLNSFHRKTGLTQLEKNNEMQDGILDGILSQVDDAYIEKTEQSNVIHLDDSGDGVVVLDSIEGNTMVNLANIRKTYINHGVIANDIITLTQKDIDQNYALSKKDLPHKIGEKYTVVINVIKNTCSREKSVASASPSGLGVGDYALNFSSTSIQQGFTGVRKILGTTREVNSNVFFHLCLIKNTTSPSGEFAFQIMVLEGDWTNREIPASYFEGLQSSFEDKVNDEGKYEIEILMKNKNLLDLKNPVNVGYTPAKMEGDKIVLNSSGVEGERISMAFPVYMKKGSTYRFSYSNIEGNSEVLGSTVQMHPNLHPDGQFGISTKNPFTWDKESGIYYARIYNMYVAGTVKANVQLEENSVATTYVEPKQNKIKLLINEPLRAVGDIKDKLCIINNKLMVERNCEEIVLDGSERWYVTQNRHIQLTFSNSNRIFLKRSGKGHCDNFAVNDKGDNIYLFPILQSGVDYIRIANCLDKWSTENEFKQWLQANPTRLVYELEEPYYEEVLNEYGEPIILEGYENGTLYIDSTVIPTTTVRYTPKMESFKTLKEVNKNNNLITLDINENIIPYMMDVDYMIMEKELCLLNTKNIRKMEELDMTSMQKRTQDMLERLIKGKTLTKQECKTRVTTYLNAGKITDDQAEELMLVISEIYN